MTQSTGVRVITPRSPDGVIHAAGDDFGLESDGHLVVYARGSKIAVYAPGQWVSAEVFPTDVYRSETQRRETMR